MWRRLKRFCNFCAESMDIFNFATSISNSCFSLSLALKSSELFNWFNGYWVFGTFYSSFLITYCISSAFSINYTLFLVLSLFPLFLVVGWSLLLSYRVTLVSYYYLTESLLLFLINTSKVTLICDFSNLALISCPPLERSKAYFSREVIGLSELGDVNISNSH